MGSTLVEREEYTIHTLRAGDPMYAATQALGIAMNADSLQRSNIAELMRILQDIFAREPPVISKQTQQNQQNQMNRPPPQQQAQQLNGAAPPVPPLPPELAGPSTSTHTPQPQARQSSQPPAPPPKPFHDQRRSSALVPNSPPPVPPHPQQRQQPSSQYGAGIDVRASGPPTSHRYNQPPPLPPQQRQQRPPSVYDSPHGPISPMTPGAPPAVAAWAQEQANQQRYQQHPLSGPPQPGPAYQPPHPNPPHYSQHIPNPQAPPQQSPKPAPPPPDLLTSPFDPLLPINRTPLPAPEVPPNPEKDALLATLSRTLTNQLHAQLQTNTSALTPLQAQHTALRSSLQSLTSESSALSALSTTLASNEAILHRAMRDADATIARAKDMKVPGVDEVLVAPTVVGGQIYDLVAEERSCREAREVLGRALDRGRVGVESWVRANRGLAREEFRAKWLVERAAVGMGLVGAEEVGSEGGSGNGSGGRRGKGPGGGGWV
ncbi:MAG: hypothetical protein MMC23_007830 [Stictis urceolatum]|nr:hypothetical protein [Stictis urceolata]